MPAAKEDAKVNENYEENGGDGHTFRSSNMVARVWGVTEIRARFSPVECHRIVTFKDVSTNDRPALSGVTYASQNPCTSNVNDHNCSVASCNLRSCMDEPSGVPEIINRA